MEGHPVWHDWNGLHHFWSTVQKNERGQRLEDRRGGSRLSFLEDDFISGLAKLRSLYWQISEDDCNFLVDDFTKSHS
jgi:hypothetical protein